MENIQKTIDLSFSDNFFSKEEHKIIYDYCINNRNYFFGEKDSGNGTPPTGFVNEIPETHLVCKIMNTILRERVEFIRSMKLTRIYVNCFAPKENGYFHTDGDCVTFLYYPNMEQYDIDEGGETTFESVTIKPEQGKLLVFPPLWMFPHRGEPPVSNTKYILSTYLHYR